MLTHAKSAHPLFVLAGLMAASLAGLALLPKIPQDQAYQLFADQRALVSIRMSGTSSRTFLLLWSAQLGSLSIRRLLISGRVANGG